MKFLPGDKVRFLDDVGGGIVKYFTSPDTVVVETEDGFEIPVKESRLVKAENLFEGKPQTDNETPKSAEKKEKTVKTKGNTEKLSTEPEAKPSGIVYLAIVPENPFSISVSKLEFYLIDDASWNFLYTMAEEKNQQMKLLAAGKLTSHTKFLAGMFSQNLVSKMVLRISLLPYKKEPYRYYIPADLLVDLRKYAFYKPKTFQENTFFDKSAFLFPIFDESGGERSETNTGNHLQELIAEKMQPFPSENRKNKPKFPEVEEVDLHIHELVENPGELPPAEILRIQMARFTTALEGAILANQKRIIFIHGVGNGKLKYEIRKTLEEKYSHLHYQDASYEEFGFGATMVILRK